MWKFVCLPCSAHFYYYYKYRELYLTKIIEQQRLTMGLYHIGYYIRMMEYFLNQIKMVLKINDNINKQSKDSTRSSRNCVSF